MGCYRIGQPGHLLPIDGSHAGLVRGWRDVTTIHDQGLAPAWAFMSRRRPGRVWRIGLEHSRVEEISNLHELYVSQSAPFMLVDPWAQATNVLTLRGSLIDVSGVSVVGGYDLADGGHASVAVRNDAASVESPSSMWAGMGPVLPGRAVTASAYIGAPWPCHVELIFLDAAQQSLGAHWSPTVTGLGRLQRVHVTATPPAGAVAAWVLINNAQVAARAALSWTTGPTAWGIGGVAQQALITDVSDNVEIAVPDPSSHLRLMGTSFTVTEVGV